MKSLEIRLTFDRYGGVTIDNSTIPEILDEFERKLSKVILAQNGKKLLWITLPIEKSDCVPILTKHNFVFHDCNESSITLLKRLAVDPTIPTPTNHTIGVGAFVMDENEILVVKDSIYKRFKLPGGYIDNKENISQALTREVFEETGIKIKPESIITLGHFSPGQFGESNIYIVCKAKPLSKEINITDEHEILEAKWISIDDYLNCEEVHSYNKKIVKTALHNEGIKLEISDLFFDGKKQYEFFF